MGQSISNEGSRDGAQGNFTDKYPVTISYAGNFRMRGMSAINRSEGVDWTVQVGGKPTFPSNSTVLIVLIVAIAVVGLIIAITTIKWKRRSDATLT